MTAALPIFGASRPPIDAHLLARRILSASRFRMRVETPSRKTWWDFAVGWLSDRWNQLVYAFAHHVRVGATTSIAAGDIILLVAAGAVLFVAIRLVANYVREGTTAKSVQIVPPRVAAEALYACSLRIAAEGDYAAAITLLFRSALVALDLRGIVHDEPSLTVNESRQEVRRRAPRFTAPFDALARIFTAAVYAEALVTPAQWSAAREAYDKLAQGSGDAA